jgi:hypothetical protein
VSTSPPTIADEVERYLRTGETDPYLAAWPGGVIEGAHRAHADLRGALGREVRRIAEGLSHDPVPDGIGAEFTRSKVEPMVRGLFPRAEQDTVLRTLEQSVVYVTSASIEAILLENDYDSSAWDLANLYLGSLARSCSAPTPLESSASTDRRLATFRRPTSPRTTRSPTSSCTRRRMSFTTASDARSGFARRVQRSGCSTSSTGTARRSRTRARPIHA